jgi:hypothetical protein
MTILSNFVAVRSEGSEKVGASSVLPKELKGATLLSELKTGTDPYFAVSLSPSQTLLKN